MSTSNFHDTKYFANVYRSIEFVILTFVILNGKMIEINTKIVQSYISILRLCLTLPILSYKTCVPNNITIFNLTSIVKTPNTCPFHTPNYWDDWGNEIEYARRAFC